MKFFTKGLAGRGCHLGVTGSSGELLTVGVSYWALRGDGDEPMSKWDDVQITCPNYPFAGAQIETYTPGFLKFFQV